MSLIERPLGNKNNRTIIDQQNDAIKELKSQLAQQKALLNEAVGVIEFYGDPEKWMIKKAESWDKSDPRNHGDSELIKDYHHPDREWVGSVVVGGKRAREFLEKKEINQILGKEEGEK